MPPAFTTSYQYLHLQPRHIRLLKCVTSDRPNSDGTPSFDYHIVHVKLPKDGPTLEFEAVSYTWGDPPKVSVLPIQEDAGHIALTGNLTEALPYISQHSATGYLWIDQLCINQTDVVEKGHQVRLMSEIYSKSKRVIVWLGPEDESIQLCKEWLASLDQQLSVQSDASRTQFDNRDYHRYAAVARSFMESRWDPKFATALSKFWSRRYFTRGWVVQEFLLSRELVILTGNTCFDIRELEDMYCVPPNEELIAITDGSVSYRQLIQLKGWPPARSGMELLHFFRQMACCVREFSTSSYEDILYSMIGMLEGLEYHPNYEQSITQGFTRFITTIARDFGSLDFLGLCSVTMDKVINSQPPELQDLPSWVPSWSSTPFTAPWRMVVGGMDHCGDDILWDASAKRKHTQEQPLVYATISQLHVRGKIIDYIDTVSPTPIGTNEFKADADHIDSLIDKLKTDLPACCWTWTPLNLVGFLNGLAHNGREIKPFNSAEAILSPQTRYTTTELNSFSSNDSLAMLLAMGRGRRFAMTKKGTLYLVPFLRSEDKSKTVGGCPIVVLHGCIVPLVLDCVDENRQEYRVVGEAYAEGIMHGEAVKWEESEADEFILV